LKLPRDLRGDALATLLRQYGFQVTRQTGSHLRLTSSLAAILADVAAYLEMDRQQLAEQLFGR